MYDEETMRGIREGMRMAYKAKFGCDPPISDEQKIQMICDGLRAKHRAERVTIKIEFGNGSLNFKSEAANDR